MMSAIFSLNLLYSARNIRNIVFGRTLIQVTKEKRGESKKWRSTRSYEEQTICIPAVTMASWCARTNISKSGLKCAKRRAQAQIGRQRSTRKIVHADKREAEEGHREKERERKEKGERKGGETRTWNDGKLGALHRAAVGTQDGRSGAAREGDVGDSNGRSRAYKHVE